MPPREVLLLGEMIDAARQAQRLAASHDVESLESDRLRRDALLWNFTVLGEAAAQLPDGFRQAYPTVNWARPTQLRNRIVHGYWSIDLEVLHATAVVDLPSFVSQLEAVLEELER